MIVTFDSTTLIGCSVWYFSKAQALHGDVQIECAMVFPTSPKNASMSIHEIRDVRYSLRRHINECHFLMSPMDFTIPVAILVAV